MASIQTLSEDDRRTVAGWAADCAERVLALFENAAPGDDRPRDAIVRARAYAAGELSSADEIRWQLQHLTPQARAALRRLPALGTDSGGPLGAGLLTSGILASTIRTIQAELECD
jgi:hypothetical protein